MKRESRRLLLGSATLGCERLRVSEDIEPHTHDYCEMAIVLDGTGIHETDHGSRRLSPGDLLVVRPGAWHGYSDCRLDLANLYLAPEMVADELGLLLDDPELAMAILHGGQSRRPIEEGELDGVVAAVDQLATLGTDTTTAVRMRRRGLFWCLLAAASTARFDHDRDRAMITAPVRQALRMMTGELAHPWTIAEVAGAVGLSGSEFQRQFRRQIGIPPGSWLTRSRAERAATLLVSSDEPVGAIGRRVGWSDPNYLSRRFRSVYRTSPTAYRRRYGFASAAGRED